MVGVLVLTHGELARALVQTAEMILGPLERVESLSISPGDGPDVFKQRVSRSIEGLEGGGGVLVLVDLFGGTPCNTALALLEVYPIELVSGVNLPMLLSVGASREGESLPALAKRALESGARAVLLPRALLESRSRGS